MPRIIAACLGIFGMANAIAGLFRPALDANIWWIDWRGVPSGPARALTLATCAGLLVYAVFPAMNSWRRDASLGAAGLLLAVCVLNSVTYYTLLYRGAIRSTLPIPLSLFIAAALLWIARDMFQNRESSSALDWRLVTAALVLCLIGFPLAQIFLFGKTDYSRQADVAIVFGARVYADGSPSTALYDRVRTACDLQRRGLVKKLIFSGGPGDGAFHETDVMRTLAIQAGVPEEDIFLDREGLNTRATLENARAFGAERMLAVSHFYHLPRIKLESQRLGLEIRTVPAQESYTLTKMPLLIGREIAALWMYYLKPPLGPPPSRAARCETRVLESTESPGMAAVPVSTRNVAQN